MDDAKFELRIVTPEEAKRILSENFTKQRHVRENTVQKYADDMINNRWDFNNPQPIIISDTGKLLDGQHRLLAVIRSGKAIPFYFAIGVPENTYLSIDTNDPRKVTDRIDVPQKTNVAALTKRVLTLQKGFGLNDAVRGTKPITQREQVEYINQNASELLRTIDRAASIRTAFGKLGPISGYSIVLHMASTIYGEDSQTAIVEAAKEPTRTSMAFQRFLMRSYSGQAAPNQVVVVSGFVMFCDAVLQGRECVSYNKRTAYMKKWDAEYMKVMGES